MLLYYHPNSNLPHTKVMDEKKRTVIMGVHNERAISRLKVLWLFRYPIASYGQKTATRVASNSFSIYPKVSLFDLHATIDSNAHYRALLYVVGQHCTVAGI